MHLLILRPMRRVVLADPRGGDLGHRHFLQSLAYLIYGEYTKVTLSPLPKSTVFLMSGDRLPIGSDALAIIGIAIALSVALTIVYRYTRVGRLTSAVAENDLV